MAELIENWGRENNDVDFVKWMNDQKVDEITNDHRADILAMIYNQCIDDLIRQWMKEHRE